MTEPALCPDPGIYLPQKPPMVVLSRAVSVTDDEVVCECDTGRGGPLEPFLEGGEAPGALFLEMMAQTVGVWAGYRRQCVNAPALGIGFLMSARAVKLGSPSVPAGETLSVRMRKVLYEGNLGCFEGTVRSGDKVLASGRVSVCEPDAEQMRRLFGE